MTLVQEGRFQLTDDRGVSHLFILGPYASAETEQLAPLQRQAGPCARAATSLRATLIGNTTTSDHPAD